MTILIFGGSGTVGRSLVPIMAESGEKVRVATRSEAYAATLPAGVEPVIADMDDPESLRRALDGVESVFLLVANEPREAHRGLVTVALAIEASTQHLVFLSNDLSTRTHIVPHAGAKIAIEAAVRASGIPYTILRPTCFAQNDYMVKDAILAGAYPTPMGEIGVARVDTRDVARAAANALLQRRAQNEVFVLSSLEAPNGEGAAALWAEALGRPVVYPNLSPEAFAAGAQEFLPPWLNFDLLIMHRHFQAAGHPITSKDIEAQVILLPDGPRSYTDFVEETAGSWIGSN